MTNNQLNVTFTACPIFELLGDCAVLFLTTAFTRCCTRTRPDSLLTRETSFLPVSDAGIYTAADSASSAPKVKYGAGWIPHLSMLFWDVGVVSTAPPSTLVMFAFVLGRSHSISGGSVLNLSTSRSYTINWFEKLQISRMEPV